MGWKASVARGCSSITPVSPEIYPPCFGLSWSSRICCIVSARTDGHRLFWLLPSLVILALFRPHLCPFEEHLEVVLKYRLSGEKFLLMMSRSNINRVKCKMWRYAKESRFESPTLQSSRCLITIIVCDQSFTLFSSFLALSARVVIVNKVVCCREHPTDFSSRRKRHYTFDFKCYKQGIIFLLHFACQSGLLMIWLLCGGQRTTWAS